jgi:hypothetical protein
LIWLQVCCRSAALARSSSMVMIPPGASGLA